MTQERILVVDDEKGVVRSCVRILQREGYVVSGITDSYKAPELLKQETFDLLLTDIKMPKLDGLELLRISKEIDPHITVVLITGYGTMEDAIEAIRLGAQGFLMKPFEPRELLDTVKDNLSRRTLIRDSLRLQTLLPLLEINQILQVSGGEISLVQRVLEIAQKAIGATRLACWLRSPTPGSLSLPPPTPAGSPASAPILSEVAVISAGQSQSSPTPTFSNPTVVGPRPPVGPPAPLPSRLPDQAITQVLNTARPVWVLANNSLVGELAGHPNIIGALIPLIIKSEVAGILTAETGNDRNSGPFGRISLELLSVLAGQLAIIIENVQLFQQAQAILALNEDIIQTMTNGLIVVDTNNRIIAFNPAASAMLSGETNKRPDAGGAATSSTPVEEPVSILYRPMSEVMPKLINDTQVLVNIFEATLKSNAAQPYQEITVQRQDGQLLPLSVRTAPLKGKNKDQEPVGVVGVIEDLSEIKALEAERRRLDRLAALGEMAAIVAHEIRNPVAGIAAGVEYLTRNTPKGSVEFEGASMIQGEIRRVNRILEDILFVARPLQLNLAYESLPKVIEGVIQRYLPQARASGVEILCEHDENLPLMNIDQQRLEQVFNNLFINGIQAMPGGGRLLLKSRIDKSPTNDARDVATITITDTGTGISEVVQQRIFEPFFTTKTKGTGLGLSIARRIIEEHGGTINVSSRENDGSPAASGTCFTIKLPIEKRIARKRANRLQP